MVQGKCCHFGGVVLLFISALTLTQTSQGQQKQQQQPNLQRVLIETSKPYDRVIAAIEAHGGQVTYQYKYVDGIAAEVTDEALAALQGLVGTAAISKDVDIETPQPANATRGRGAQQRSGTLTTGAAGAQPSRISDVATLAKEHPEIYLLNNAGTQIEKLHALGLTGEGTTVAVIDSGLRPGYKLLLDSVVGGFDLVDDPPAGPGGDGPADWKQSTSDGHGTFAAGLIVGDAAFPVTGLLQEALQRYAPGAIVDGKLPLIGTAPNAKIYVVRVFGDNISAGTSVSRILAAIQHVIDQRDLYERTGGRDGVRIDVANLSLGISTLAAGRTLLDQSIDAMLEAGIVPVVAIGDSGPSTLTTLNPGSSISAVTVGASSPATGERLMNELFYGTQFPDIYFPGIGAAVRPFDGTEVAWFSSRGPNADGRLDPDVVAAGVGNIGQGYCPEQILDACYKRLSLASGTSFSAPIVSGIAAVLRGAFPNATATQIRNALIATARTNQIENYFDDLDRGHGLPNAWAAYQLLGTGTVPDILPAVNDPADLVRDNIEDNTDLEVSSGFVTRSMNGLKPGARGEILYEVPQGAERVVVTLSNVQMLGPQQNPFFGGDALFLYIHNARTGTAPVSNYLVNGELFIGGEPEREFVFEHPETGIMRITLNPDTLNAGTVSADVTIDTTLEVWPPATFSDSIHDGETKMYTLPVETGTTRLDFLLTWDHDWAHYPTSDIDLVVCSPDIPATITDCRALGNKQGATLASPERATIANPAAGNWTLLVRGFNIPSQTDNFKLRVTKTHP